MLIFLHLCLFFFENETDLEKLNCKTIFDVDNIDIIKNANINGIKIKSEIKIFALTYENYDSFNTIKKMLIDDKNDIITVILENNVNNIGYAEEFRKSLTLKYNNLKKKFGGLKLTEKVSINNCQIISQYL